MKTIFENNEFRLLLTGHDYDFVGIIETKTDEPLTFFFEEETDIEGDVYEDMTEFVEVWQGLKEHEDGDDFDEAEEMAFTNNATSWLRTRDDKSTGFLSDCQQRGWFLALVKNYCPERLPEIAWA